MRRGGSDPLRAGASLWRGPDGCSCGGENHVCVSDADCWVDMYVSFEVSHLRSPARFWAVRSTDPADWFTFVSPDVHHFPLWALWERLRRSDGHCKGDDIRIHHSTLSNPVARWSAMDNTGSTWVSTGIKSRRISLRREILSKAIVRRSAEERENQRPVTGS